MPIIIEEMAKRGTPLRVEGKWACGPCPSCGGNDRFRVVYDSEKGREFYNCRQCDAKGDGIQFLRDYAGLDFAAAKYLVEQTRDEHTPALPLIENYDAWFEANAAFVMECRDALLSEDRALAWLRKRRGILPKTAEKFMLGLNSSERWEARRKFGICVKNRADGSEVDLCLPRGISIPIVVGGILRGVQVRRFEAFKGNRYLTLPGSELVPMIFSDETGRTALIVESFLDGMLLAQEVGKQCTVIALGSASVALPSGVKELLAATDCVLVALDSDDAGAAQAWKHLIKEFPLATRCVIPTAYGKDPCEAFCNGLDLAEWVEAGVCLAKAQVAVGHPIIEKAHEPSLVEVGSVSAALRCIADPGEAREAIAEIVASCPAIGVALEVVPRTKYVNHPHAGRHPKLSRLRRVCVYAQELEVATVFEMGEIQRADLSPLWNLMVVFHDGAEAMLHISALRNLSERVDSTLLMANALSNERLELDATLKRYIKLPPIAEDADTWQGLAKRAVALSLLYPELHARLVKRNTLHLYRLLQSAQGAVAALEVDGIALETGAHAQLCAGWAEEQATPRGELPAELDPDSHKDVRAWLLRAVPGERRKGWKKTSTGELSTCDDNLLLAADLPEIQALREYRRLGKLLSAYGEHFAAHLNPVTARLHGHWRIGGMVTGRTGVITPNLQGLPRDPAFRALFRAPEGRRLLVGDVSQFQLRILAHVAGDKSMLAAYADGIDLHTATAALLAGVGRKEVSKEHRRLAKAANFGVAFGQGVRAFRDYAARRFQVNLSELQAKRIRNAWLGRFAGVARWHEQTDEYLRGGYAIETAAGRVARKADLAGNALPQALAFQIQGTEAEIMLRAIAAMYPVLREHGALLCLFSHDELVLEVEDDAATVVAVTTAVEGAIAVAFRHYFPEATVEGLVEVRAVSHWGEAK